MPKSHTTPRANSLSALKSQRVDKWLWAARFYKTRALASDAVKTGKVLINGEKSKPSKEITQGSTIAIRQSYFGKTITVLELSPRRGPATVAAGMYKETADSIANRARLQKIQQSQPAIRRSGQGRPTKRERRRIISFTSKD